MSQQMKIKAKFDNWLNLDQPTKSLANFFMSDAGLYMYGHYQYTPAVKAGFEYTKQVSLDAVQIVLRGEAAEAGESGNNLSLFFYKDANKITTQLFDNDTLVFKNEKPYAEYDDPISAYDINNATNALDPETKGIDFFELGGNIPLADISDNPSEPTKFNFTGGRDEVDDGVDGIKASILQNHRTFTLTENNNVEYISLWVPYTNTAITDDVDVVSNICSIPDVASTLTQATSNLYLGKYTYQGTGGGSGSGSGSGSGDTSIKARAEIPFKYGPIRNYETVYNPLILEATEAGDSGNSLSVQFSVAEEFPDPEEPYYSTNVLHVKVFDSSSATPSTPVFNASEEIGSSLGESGYHVSASVFNDFSDNGHSITDYVTAVGDGEAYFKDDDSLTLQLSTETHASAQYNGFTFTAVRNGSAGNSLRVEFYVIAGAESSYLHVSIYDGDEAIYTASTSDNVYGDGNTASISLEAFVGLAKEYPNDGEYMGDIVVVSCDNEDDPSITIPTGVENKVTVNLSGGGVDLLPSIEQESVANVSNTSLIDSMSSAAKHNYLISGTSLNKSVTIKPYIGDVINTDSSLYPSNIVPGVSTVNVDFNIGEDDRIDFQLRTSSFTVEDEDNQKHNSIYYRIGIYPLGDNTVDDIKDLLITNLSQSFGRRLVTGMTGTTYDDKVFYLDHLYHDVADMFYVESNFDNGTSHNFPIKAIFPYRGSYISNYDAILYMQLCNSDGTPSDSIGVINGIEVSLDGETWNTAEYTGDTNMAALDIVELTDENKTSFIPVSIN